MVESMLDAQAIYGGYRRFVWSDPRDGNQDCIALGGDIMHLLPEDRFDRQPVWSADGTACLVADVRLDNREDLVRELGLPHPEELADSTILMQAWMRWDAACLDHIIGGFAFAVWTPAKRELFAARDHTGERPLFYHRSRNFFALASMPKGLLAVPGVFSGFNQQRMVDSLVLFAPDWKMSYYAGIERLPLGHLLRVRPDSFECKPYWHPCDAKPTHFSRDEEYVEALLDIFDKAVAARLRTPRAVGAQLSAGLDSSSVMATAARLLAAQGNGLTAFTAVPRNEYLGKGLPGRLPDEGPAAAEVAAMYPNVEHVLIDSAGCDLLADMKAWTDAMDEPAQNCINLLWIGAIMAAARDRGIGVMVHGLAGNATVSAEGMESITALFRSGRWIELFQLARNLREREDMSYRGAAALATNGLIPLWLKRRIKPGVQALNLDYSPVHPDLVVQYGLEKRMIQNRVADITDVRTMRARFFERFDPAPLNSATRARAGLDKRDPMADKRIFEYCYSLPIEQYTAGAQLRSLARRAMKGTLPESTLNRVIRGQQGADWYVTVKEALPSLERELPLLEQSPLVQHFVDLPRVKRLLHTWPQTGHETGPIAASWNYALTRAFATGYMLRQRDPAVAVPTGGAAGVAAPGQDAGAATKLA